jgi:hypothetical protein
VPKTLDRGYTGNTAHLLDKIPQLLREPYTA